MKRLISIILASFMCISFAACGQATESANQSAADTTTEKTTLQPILETNPEYHSIAASDTDDYSKLNFGKEKNAQIIDKLNMYKMIYTNFYTLMEMSDFGGCLRDDVAELYHSRQANYRDTEAAKYYDKREVNTRIEVRKVWVTDENIILNIYTCSDILYVSNGVEKYWSEGWNHDFVVLDTKSYQIISDSISKDWYLRAKS